MTIKEQVIEDLLEVPKTEIHLHIEAVTTADTVWKLIKKHKLEIDGINSIEDLKSKFNITSLHGFVDLFINVIQTSFKEESDFNYVMDDLHNYLRNNNIVYAEVFLAPTTFIKQGLDLGKIIEILQLRADEIEKSSNININYIIDVSRGFGVENAMDNLNLTIKYRTKRIVAIGLGGNEKNGKSKDFEPVFKKAKEYGFRLVAHAGEDANYHSIEDAINILKVERIGHGTSAMGHRDFVNWLRDIQIPLEICPTSNIFTKAYVSDINKHPVKCFYEHGLFITINSDDPVLFGSTLLEEYAILVENEIFTKKEIGKLILANLKASFLSEDKKADLKIIIEDSLNNRGYL